MAVARRSKPMQVVLLTCSTTVAQLGFKRKATAVLKSNLVRSMAIFIVKTHYPSGQT